MFNPFFARPIGSSRFEDHLINQMIQAEEKKNMEAESIPEVKLVLHAVTCDSTDYNPIDEGYKALDVAIFARALADYLYSYAQWLKAHDEDSPSEWVFFSRCAVLENEYFRTDPKKADLFNYVLINIVHKDYYVRDRIKTIKDFAHKIECAV